MTVGERQMQTAIKVVRAGAEDAERIAPLFDAYRQFYKQRSNLAAAKAFLSERLIRSESVIFLALSGEGEREKAVGFTQLYPCFNSVALKPLWILYDLYVAPQARRLGVGKALMDRAQQFAAETKAWGLWLETAVDNIPGQKLYERQGWIRDEEFYRYQKML